MDSAVFRGGSRGAIAPARINLLPQRLRLGAGGATSPQTRAAESALGGGARAFGRRGPLGGMSGAVRHAGAAFSRLCDAALLAVGASDALGSDELWIARMLGVEASGAGKGGSADFEPQWPCDFKRLELFQGVAPVAA